MPGKPLKQKCIGNYFWKDGLDISENKYSNEDNESVDWANLEKFEINENSKLCATRTFIHLFDSMALKTLI